jgi:hypothetical protein
MAWPVGCNFEGPLSFIEVRELVSPTIFSDERPLCVDHDPGSTAYQQLV